MNINHTTLLDGMRISVKLNSMGGAKPLRIRREPVVGEGEERLPRRVVDRKAPATPDEVGQLQMDRMNRSTDEEADLKLVAPGKTDNATRGSSRMRAEEPHTDRMDCTVLLRAEGMH